MFSNIRAALRPHRLACLPASLIFALGCVQTAAHASPRPQPFSSHGEQPTPTRVVHNCLDDGSPGSLRYEVDMAVSGDTIDLSLLTCSTITLSASGLTPYINITQDDLALLGPADHVLTIDGANHSNVLEHFGHGTLSINNLTIANGYYSGSAFPKGGCIYSSSFVSLVDSVVTHCSVKSTSAAAAALGGAVYAATGLSLQRSRIVDGNAFTLSGSYAEGGGAFVRKSFYAYESTIDSSSAVAIGSGVYGLGGGLMVASGYSSVYDSTISNNHADLVGAVDFAGDVPYNAKIVNSTISSNTASVEWAGVFSEVPLTLANSTIALNRATHDSFDNADGLYGKSSLTLQSSIIADNAGQNGPSDLGGRSGIVASGFKNVITSTTIATPGDTHTECPRLGPLLDHGGPTQTQMLRPGSVAIDHGEAPASLLRDQRGDARVVNLIADIGAIELQADDRDDRIAAGGFDGVCDD